MNKRELRLLRAAAVNDDSAALQLAAELRIDLEMGLCYCEATWVDLVKSETHRYNEDWGAGDTALSERMARIRRAIVRAATAEACEAAAKGAAS